MKKRIPGLFLALVFSCSGCRLLSLPFRLLNSLFQLGKSIIPYALLTFSLKGEGEEPISPEGLPSKLCRVLQEERDWERFSPLENALEELKASAEKRVIVAVPLACWELSDLLNGLVERVEDLLLSQNMEIPARPDPPKGRVSGRGRVKVQSIRIVNGIGVYLDPPQVQRLERILGEKGMHLIFLPFPEENPPG